MNRSFIQTYIWMNERFWELFPKSSLEQVSTFRERSIGRIDYVKLMHQPTERLMMLISSKCINLQDGWWWWCFFQATTSTYRTFDFRNQISSSRACCFDASWTWFDAQHDIYRTTEGQGERALFEGLRLTAHPKIQTCAWIMFVFKTHSETHREATVCSACATCVYNVGRGSPDIWQSPAGDFLSSGSHISI